MEDQYDKLHHRSIWEQRNATHPAEKAYSEMWEKLNKRYTGINGGLASIELILQPPVDEIDLIDPGISQRDLEVAATVIQWLATSCGQGFLYEAEKKAQEYENDFKAARKKLREEDVARRHMENITERMEKRKQGKFKLLDL